MAYWIHNHLPYNTLQFFPKLCAFNIGWYEGPPQRSIHSYIQPTGYLLRGEPPNPAFAIVLYDGTHALPFGNGLWAIPLSAL